LFLKAVEVASERILALDACGDNIGRLVS
jgi:hypothetical protein